MYSSLPLWWLFTVIIPNMDYRTTFFGQLKKPYDALRFLNFAFCVAKSNKSPVSFSLLRSAVLVGAESCSQQSSPLSPLSFV